MGVLIVFSVVAAGFWVVLFCFCSCLVAKRQMFGFFWQLVAAQQALEVQEAATAQATTE
jgi:hypothetical protein